MHPKIEQMLSKYIKNIFSFDSKLVGIWETKHGENRENLMRLYEDGTGMIFYWVYELDEEPKEVVYEIIWKKVIFRRIALKLKNENKFTVIKYVIKNYVDENGKNYHELINPKFHIGNNYTVKFFWKINGKLYREKNT